MEALLFSFSLHPVLAGLVMLDGFVYAVGGWEGRSRLDSVECYNPHTNTWQFTESVKMAVTSPAVVALDGLLYVTGMGAFYKKYTDLNVLNQCCVSVCLSASW